MDGTSLLLAEQFPDMPAPQTTLRTTRLELIKAAKDGSFFFHNFCEHWALSYIRDDVIYLYDSLQPKCIHCNLAEQLSALYGNWKVKVLSVQMSKFKKETKTVAALQ